MDQNDPGERAARDAPAVAAIDWSVLKLHTPEVSRPKYRLFSPGQSALAAFLGGPVAGGIVAAISLWRLGRRVKSVLAVFLGCALFPIWVGVLMTDLPVATGSMRLLLSLFHTLAV